MPETFLIDIGKHFPGSEVSFTTRLGKGSSWTVLFGPSGAGKSTVLRCIAGLENPDRGNIHFNGEVWNDCANRIFMPPQKRRIGYLFQELALFPHLSVGNNIGYNLVGLSRDEKTARVSEMLELFRLTGLEDRNVQTLSGGEKQRVALARTLSRRPRLLLLDEPFSALDTPTRIQLRKELRSLLSQFDIPILVVTHDRSEALSLGDRLIVMDQGKILQEGPIHEVFSKPNKKRTAEIVGMENVFPGVLVEKQDGIAHIKIRETLLNAVAGDIETGNVMVGIRAEDILISCGGENLSSARNHLHGVIQNIASEESLVRVTVDCGFLIDALITRESRDKMDLQIARKVDLTVKTTAIHLFPHR